jgi:cytochrome P450
MLFTSNARGNRLPPKTTRASAWWSIYDPLAFVTDNLQRYPDVFRSGLLGFSAYVVHHPEYIHHVLSANARNYRKFEKYRYLRLLGGNGLVTNEGQCWVRQRQRIQPAFNHAAIDRASATMAEESEAMVLRLARHTPLTCNLAELMGELTIAIVARALFSADVAAYVPTIRSELEQSQRLGNILLRTPLPLYNVVPYLPVFRRITEAAERLREIVSMLIARRRASATRPGDLLDALLNAQADEESPMSDEQLRDEVLTLLLAGHETTLLALSWAIHLTALHPTVYDRLHDEAANVMRRGVSGIASLDAAPWSRAVAREALRLYPPAYWIGRTAVDDDRIGEYDVPRGTNLVINIYGMHRHPAYWSNPNDFQPERMLDPQAWDPKRFVFLPFGVGPRSCIGSRFSLYEMQVVLLSFAHAFAFTPVSDGTVHAHPRITLAPSRPIAVRLSPLRSPLRIYK